MTAEPFGGRALLVDKSAWERRRDEGIREEWARAVESDQLLLCPIIELELLYSAPSPAAFVQLEELLTGFRSLRINTETFALARQAMRELARGSQHRLPLPDLLVAACAAQHAVDVLHADRHYERLAEVLPVAAVSLSAKAPGG